MNERKADASASRLPSIGMVALVVVSALLLPPILIPGSLDSLMSRFAPPETADAQIGRAVGGSGRLMVSWSADHLEARPLENAQLSGTVYVYAEHSQDIAEVQFYVDDEQRTSAPTQTVGAAPFMLGSMSSSGVPPAFDTTTLEDGPHTLLAVIALEDGHTEVTTAAFRVANGAADEHSALLTELRGFAAGTTGGGGGTPRWVTSLEDSGPGSLREALAAPGPGWIRFDPALAGTIILASPLEVPSNTTIDGRGADIVLSGGKSAILSIRDSKNVIVTNLQFDQVDYDAIMILGDATENVWIHRNIFWSRDQEKEDGAIDVTWGAHNVTISWNRFEDWGSVILLAAEDFKESAADRVTIHHNYFDKCVDRMPLAQFGRVHVYNNYLYAFRSGAIEADYAAQVWSEGNIIEATDPNTYGIYVRESEEGRTAMVKSVGDWIVGDPVVELNPPYSGFDPSDFYPYQADAADKRLGSALQEQSGWQAG